jgi:hypothetical protein
MLSSLVTAGCAQDPICFNDGKSIGTPDRRLNHPNPMSTRPCQPRLKVQAAIPIHTVGAQIAGPQEPDAGEGAIEFVDKSLRDGGQDDLKIETRRHLERDPLQNIGGTFGGR